MGTVRVNWRWDLGGTEFFHALVLIGGIQWFLIGLAVQGLRRFGSLRRRLRARRGLCTACAYPAGESAVCSECGAAVRSKKRE